MECPNKNCQGRMRVVRSVAGKGCAAQERRCDECAERGCYAVSRHSEDMDARTLAKKLMRAWLRDL